MTCTCLAPRARCEKDIKEPEPEIITGKPYCYSVAKEYERRANAIPERLQRLAANNPIVGICLGMWKNGKYGWEECLIEMVSALADSNRRLLANLLEFYQRTPFDGFNLNVQP